MVGDGVRIGTTLGTCRLVVFDGMGSDQHLSFVLVTVFCGRKGVEFGICVFE